MAAGIFSGRHVRELCQETDAAGRKILHRAGNAKLARLDQAFDHRTFRGQRCHAHPDIGFGHRLNKGSILRGALAAGLARRHGRLDMSERRRQIAELDMIDRTLDGAAVAVTEHHEIVRAPTTLVAYSRLPRKSVLMKLPATRVQNTSPIR